MDSDLTKAFQKAKYNPNVDLSDGILLSIYKRQRRKDRIKLWAYGSISAFSFIGLFPAIKLLVSDFSKSGFYEYISLAFSDSRALSYWKEIILSISESLPMTSLILSLTLVFVFVLSLRFIARNIRNRAYLSVA
jgi:hypothetical protein